MQSSPSALPYKRNRRLFLPSFADCCAFSHFSPHFINQIPMQRPQNCFSCSIVQKYKLNTQDQIYRKRVTQRTPCSECTCELSATYRVQGSFSIQEEDLRKRSFLLMMEPPRWNTGIYAKVTTFLKRLQFSQHAQPAAQKFPKSSKLRSNFRNCLLTNYFVQLYNFVPLVFVCETSAEESVIG